MTAGGGGEGGSASGSSSAAVAAAGAAGAVKTTSTSSASSTAVVTSLWMKLNGATELLLPNIPNVAVPGFHEDFVFVPRNATCPLPVLLPTMAANDCTIATPLRSPNQDFQTLQLFPLRNEEEDGYNEGYDKEMERVDFVSGCHVGEEDHLRRQFYEFLPLKN